MKRPPARGGRLAAAAGALFIACWCVALAPVHGPLAASGGKPAGGAPARGGEPAAPLPSSAPPDRSKNVRRTERPPARASLTVADVEGIRKTIAERRGVPLLVNFWAVWCDPCVEELPDLAHLETRFASSRIRVLGVSCDLLVEDDSPEVRRKVAETLRRARVSYPNLLYSGNETPLIESFNLPGPIPVSILYAPDGSELRRWTGRLPLGELKKALERP